MYTVSTAPGGSRRCLNLKSIPRRVRERGDDALDLQVLVHGRQPLVPAESAHLVPAERRVRVEGVVAVHPHGAGAHRPRHPVGDVQALGHDAGGEPVLGAVGLLDHLINRPGMELFLGSVRRDSEWMQKGWDGIGCTSISISMLISVCGVRT